MDKDELREKIAAAITAAFAHKPGWNAVCADAVLTAITEAGCTIVPNEPTLTQLKVGARTIRHQNQHGGDDHDTE